MMENKKSPLLVYREKMAEVHTPEEIKAAFDDSFYAVCFNYDRGHGGSSTHYSRRFGRLIPM